MFATFSGNQSYTSDEDNPEDAFLSKTNGQSEKYDSPGILSLFGYLGITENSAESDNENNQDGDNFVNDNVNKGATPMLNFANNYSISDALYNPNANVNIFDFLYKIAFSNIMKNVKRSSGIEENSGTEIDYNVIQSVPQETAVSHKSTQARNKKPYSYFFLDRKLWYTPLFFSVWFMFYVLAIVIKAISRHKIEFPVSEWKKPEPEPEVHHEVHPFEHYDDHHHDHEKLYNRKRLDYATRRVHDAIQRATYKYS